jgi:hypothetical protein
MLLRKSFFVLAALAEAFSCSGCAVPHYDVPYVAGRPNVQTIVERIQCELKEMVRDAEPDHPASPLRNFLLDGDFDVIVSLSLEVNDTGGLAPSLTYLEPLSKVASFSLSATGVLSESRDHNFTENIQFSMREILAAWRQYKSYFDCPSVADTNLAGTLGIEDFVSMAALTPNLALGPSSSGASSGGAQSSSSKGSSKTSSANSVFGGSIQFLVTKNLSALGPTWTLVHFKGPGTVSLSEINTDKITLAFAEGPNVGKRMTAAVPKHPLNPNAEKLLQQMLISSINTQVTTLLNK